MYNATAQSDVEVDSIIVDISYSVSRVILLGNAGGRETTKGPSLKGSGCLYLQQALMVSVSL